MSKERRITRRPVLARAMARASGLVAGVILQRREHAADLFAATRDADPKIQGPFLILSTMLS